MIKANFHTHTYLCKHASGTPKEYVEKAISIGIKTLGFSDHSPYIFSESDYYSDFRMFPNEYEKYVKEILGLKKEYADKIKIYLGVELEYYPKDFNNTKKFLQSYPIEYFILSQHFINNEYDGIYSPCCSTQKEIERYFNQLIEGINLGCFSYIAHPDLVGFGNERAFFEKQAVKLLEEAKKLDIPIEYNFLGMVEKRHYPNELFFSLASQVGNKIIYGCDAHSEAFLESSQIYANSADENLKKFNFERTEKIKLLNGKYV